MEYGITVLTLLALFCQAKSQLCVSPGVVPQVIANTPTAAPQVVTTPIVATTIVDNSVSVALANALQLLIVSDIIESKLGAPCLNNLVLNPLDTPCYSKVEVIQPIAEYVAPIPPCATPIEVISPCRPVIEPYPCLGGYPEIISPNVGCNPCGIEIINPCLPNVCLPDVVTPRNYYNVAELLSPNFNPYNGCGLEVIAPIYGNEIVTIPSCNNGCYRGYNELITPIPYNSYGEIITPITPCGISEIVSPCGPYFGGIPEVITPISPCNCGCYNSLPEFATFGGLTEFITPYVGCGAPEIIQPCLPGYSGIPEVISPIYKPGCAGIPELLPNPYGPCQNFPEIITPIPCNPGSPGFEFCGPTAFAPSICGANDNIVNPIGCLSPIAAEILLPPAIPAQLNCNFCYSSEGPCVNFNVEPSPFGPGFCY